MVVFCLMRTGRAKTNNCGLNEAQTEPSCRFRRREPELVVGSGLSPRRNLFFVAAKDADAAWLPRASVPFVILEFLLILYPMRRQRQWDEM